LLYLAIIHTIQYYWIYIGNNSIELYNKYLLYLYYVRRNYYIVLIYQAVMIYSVHVIDLRWFIGLYLIYCLTTYYKYTKLEYTYNILYMTIGNWNAFVSYIIWDVFWIYLLIFQCYNNYYAFSCLNISMYCVQLTLFIKNMAQVRFTIKHHKNIILLIFIYE